MKRYIKSATNGWYVGEPTSTAEYGEAMSQAAKGFEKFLDDNGFELYDVQQLDATSSYKYYNCYNWGPEGLEVSVRIMTDAFGSQAGKLSKLYVDGHEIDIYKSRNPVHPMFYLTECSLYDVVEYILPNLDSEYIIWRG